MPAKQRLDSDDRGRSERDLWLVVNAELPTLQSEAQLVLEAEQLPALARHLVAKDLVAPSSRLLRRVHRHVRMAYEVLAVPGPTAVSDDPHAGSQGELPVGHRHRVRKALQQPARDA